MKALVVIPTYNEKENIAKLIGELMKVNGELEVLVVDDGSPAPAKLSGPWPGKMNGSMSYIARARWGWVPPTLRGFGTI